MLSSPSAARYLKRLLALLTVLAAFAFQARVGGMVAMPEVGSGPGSAARHAPQPAQPAADHRHGQGQSRRGHQEGHHPGAHCPFCVTGAFALEAGVLPLPTASPRLASPTPPLAPDHLPVAVRHVDARAPPALL